MYTWKPLSAFSGLQQVNYFIRTEQHGHALKYIQLHFSWSLSSSLTKGKFNWFITLLYLQSHAGKVVERHWYEKNKHIFPASRWEVISLSVSLSLSLTSMLSCTFAHIEVFYLAPLCVFESRDVMYAAHPGTWKARLEARSQSGSPHSSLYLREITSASLNKKVYPYMASAHIWEWKCMFIIRLCEEWIFLFCIKCF